MVKPFELAANAALIVVDVQEAFEDPRWPPRNNPACEANVALLIERWQATDRPVVMVRHDSVVPGSPFEPGTPGNALKAEVAGVDADLLVTKSVNSSFHGEPNLEAWLREREIAQIAIVGIQTNMCCETTARVGGNLGFDVLFVLDATATFDLTGPDGRIFTADELSAVTAANLDDEFGTVVSTAQVLDAA